VNRILFFVFALTPIALFASEGAETDILQRTVNFIIFAAVMYYLLADKIKVFFAARTESIQAELDKVQETLKASEAKVEDAKAKLEDAKKLAHEIVEVANSEVDSVKEKVIAKVENEIAHLEKSLDDKMEVETRKVKNEIVAEILDELLRSDKLDITQEELANIVLKKVA
jgi:F-type H+-transporting ATPase subunit b